MYKISLYLGPNAHYFEGQSDIYTCRAIDGLDCEYTAVYPPWMLRHGTRSALLSEDIYTGTGTAATTGTICAALLRIQYVRTPPEKGQDGRSKNEIGVAGIISGRKLRKDIVLFILLRIFCFS